MSLESLPALASIAVSLTWTPGPNNAMLSASGANYGWRRSLGHIMGVAFGFPLMLIAVAFGLIRVLERFPVVVEVLGWIGFAMLTWIAWRIATAAGPGRAARGKPLTFPEAVAFQWVNPKAWALAIYVTAGLCGRHHRRLKHPGRCRPVLLFGPRLVVCMGSGRRRHRHGAQERLASEGIQPHDGGAAHGRRSVADGRPLALQSALRWGRRFVSARHRASRSRIGCGDRLRVQSAPANGPYSPDGVGTVSVGSGDVAP